MSSTKDDIKGLKADAMHFQAIMEAVVDGLVIITVRGRIERVNQATEKIFGYRADEIVGRNVSILMPEPDKSQHDQYLSNYLSTNSSKIIGSNILESWGHCPGSQLTAH